MILLQAQIHWDGDGTYGFLPNPTLSSNSAQLPSSSALVDTRVSLCDSAVSHRHFTPGGTHVSDTTDQKPFYMTRAGCRVMCLSHA